MRDSAGVMPVWCFGNISTVTKNFRYMRCQDFLAEPRLDRRAYPSVVCEERATQAAPKKTTTRRAAPDLTAGLRCSSVAEPSGRRHNKRDAPQSGCHAPSSSQNGYDLPAFAGCLGSGQIWRCACVENSLSHY
jgi:hypothetical protein